MDEVAEMDSGLNGMNEDSSENFFILDGIQSFQANDDTSQSCPQDTNLINTSHLNMISKENYFSDEEGSLPSIPPMGDSKTSLACKAVAPASPITLAKENSQDSDAYTKDEAPSSRPINVPDIVTDADLMNEVCALNQKSNAVQKLEMSNITNNPLALSTETATINPINFVSSPQNCREVSDNILYHAPSKMMTALSTSSGINMGDKYSDVCAVSDFVGNAVKAEQSTSQPSPQPKVGYKTTVNEESISLREVRKSSTWNKCSLGDLMSFRNTPRINYRNVPTSVLLEPENHSVSSKEEPMTVINTESTNATVNDGGTSNKGLLQESTPKSLGQSFSSSGQNTSQSLGMDISLNEPSLNNNFRQNTLVPGFSSSSAMPNMMGTSTKFEADSECEISIVQEKNSRMENQNKVAHTVEDDSDSDVCILEEQIRKPYRLYKYRMKKAQFKCSECNFQTPSMPQLKMHEVVHPKGRMMKCSKCPFETRIKSCMIYHAAIHSGAKKFRCSKCTFRTDCLDTFLEHESQTFTCFRCDMPFHRSKDLMLHVLNIHQLKTKIYVCGACSYTAPQKSDVNAHRIDPKSRAKFDCHWSRVETQNNETHYCQPSPPSTAISTIVDTPTTSTATTTIKSRGKPSRVELTCKECNVICKSKSAFTRHMSKHRSELDGLSPDESSSSSFTSQNVKLSHQCLLCEMKFASMKGARLHQLQKHTLASKSSANELQCAACHFVTDEKLFFEQHLKIHSKKRSLLSVKREDLYKCTFCQFETKFEEMMRNHLVTHSESDSDFDADFEASGFGENFEVGNHVERTDLVPSAAVLAKPKNLKFKCSNCNYGTNLKKRFHNHRSLHLRQKVFSIIFNST